MKFPYLRPEETGFMEDFILREIDRLGEMLMLIARKLGLLDGNTPDYSLTYESSSSRADVIRLEAEVDNGKGYSSVLKTNCKFL